MKYLAFTNQDIEKILGESGVVDEAKVAKAVASAKLENSSLADVAVNQGLVTNEELSRLVADALDMPFMSLAGKLPTKETLALIPELVARKKRVVPFRLDEKGLHVAMADPTDLETLNFIARREGMHAIAYATTDQDIDTVLELYGEGLNNLLEIKSEKSGKVAGSEDDSSIIQIVKKVIVEAYRNRASDIHIEPREESDSVIRFRIDGILHDVTLIPMELHAQIISRIKVMAKLRTDEHQTPQDGKISFKLEDDNSEMDLRVSIVPVTEGEKAVLRLLAERSRQFSLAGIGLSENNLKKIQEAYEKPYGMVLSTGPTGCGKTTTLYAILKLLNKRHVNIMTIEDPVEYDIDGVSQIQVNPKAKLTFASGLRSILRQDPNIILVGEIRDQETAGIAINLALTGHLVLSTLHTNDSATAIPRFIDLEVEPFLIASTVSVIIAQRLVRKIHDGCKVSEEFKAADIAKKIGWELTEKMFGVKKSNPDGTVRLYQGKGCEACQGTGFQGRIGIFEVMVMDDQMRQAISQNKDAGFLEELAKKSGMIGLLEDGLGKVNMGITTIDEILGATKL
ncbi:MAG: type II/IV secretion system protein [Candidatus Moranbacteria bacterium]|nr:type II/IV secretion system protein [Candidatus Moranbacteria bacterium]